VNPDCRAGKHAACSGTAWDEHTDQLAACSCTCHTSPVGRRPAAPAPDNETKVTGL